ncbi:MAG: hypothetical protein ABIR28_05880 [Vicinamibacteria bacterium]
MRDGFNLPGFDAHVYVAMAEDPRFFTVGPWGYRILLPGLLGTFLPPRLIVPGFDWAARASLVLASGLLFVYLRILGGTIRAALVAVMVMMMTPSVDVVFANPFLVEPFALMLLLLALIAIKGGASTWLIALSLILLSLTKEIWLLLLPMIFLKEVHNGVRGAFFKTLRLGAPPLWVMAMMRWMWSPHGGPSKAGTDFIAALGSIFSNISVFLPEFLLGGLIIVAVAALWQERAREYLLEHSLTLLALFTLPLFAAAYTGEGAATSFFADDVRRLLIYALPFVAALAVHLDPDHGRTHALGRNRKVERSAMALVFGFMLAPCVLDSYSRADLSTSRDGPYVLGFTRETLRTARKLDRGEAVVLDPVERKFAWGVSPPNDLAKLRFFLRGGFGPLAHYGIHDIKMREPSAWLAIPVLQPRPLRMTLTMDARASAWITVLARGHRVGEVLVGPQAVQATFEIPAAQLFRGDNPIELRCEKAAATLPRILRLELAEARPFP